MKLSLAGFSPFSRRIFIFLHFPHEKMLFFRIFSFLIGGIAIFHSRNEQKNERANNYASSVLRALYSDAYEAKLISTLTKSPI